MTERQECFTEDFEEFLISRILWIDTDLRLKGAKIMPLKTGIRFALQELIKLRPREGFPGLVDYITRHNERYWRVYKYYTPGRQTYVLVAEGVHAGCAAGTLFWRPYAGRWQRRPEIIKHLDGTWGVNGRVYSARKYLGIVVPSGCYSGITEGGERIING